MAGEKQGFIGEIKEAEVKFATSASLIIQYIRKLIQISAFSSFSICT